jgi:hypothetical protein
MDKNTSSRVRPRTFRYRAWSARERVSAAARTADERIVWRVRRIVGRARPVVQKAGDGAARRAEPIQRPIQTKLLWPLLDAARAGSPALRTGVAVAAVVAVLGAGTAKSMLSSSPGEADPVAAAEAAPALVAAPVEVGLRGVTPNFSDAGASADPAAAVTGRKVAASGVSPLLAGKPDPAAPPEHVALAFADAFVAYEVGEADDVTAKTFSAVAEVPLAESLAGDPPRLPSGKEVPQARVLNVVLAEPAGKELEASVSLVRLRAASELRLTLRDTPEGWRVAEVLG